MKKLFMLASLFLTTTASASDNTITQLNSSALNTIGMNAGYGEIKVLCIAGYKWVFARVGSSDTNIVLVQVRSSTDRPVRCTE
jgi:hypothetical protein